MFSTSSAVALRSVLNSGTPSRVLAIRQHLLHSASQPPPQQLGDSILSFAFTFPEVRSFDTLQLDSQVSLSHLPYRAPIQISSSSTIALVAVQAYLRPLQIRHRRCGEEAFEQGAVIEYIEDGTSESPYISWLARRLVE